MLKLPPLIALCGYPKSGKSEVQRILERDFGVLPVDDGRILREACKALYGLGDDDVYTQEGKLRVLKVGGCEYTHRQLLGHLGELLEGKYGPNYMIEQTLRTLTPAQREHMAAGGSLSFGSVRRRQAAIYKAQGGICISVGPGRSEGRAQNAFDQFDESLVDRWLRNDGASLTQLTAAVHNLVAQIAIDQPNFRAA